LGLAGNMQVFFSKSALYSGFQKCWQNNAIKQIV
jgi:hypothetical protein